MKKISKIIGGLRIAMQALAAKSGVTLYIGGAEAKTDGNRIIIPDLPEDDQEAAVLARGYIDHEAAHIALTDFSIKPSQNNWLNLLEDIRIEKRQGAKYPGAAINMRQLVEVLAEKGKFDALPVETPDDRIRALMMWAFCRTRFRVLRQTVLDDIAATHELICRNIFGGPFCDQFAQIVDKIEMARSTADSLAVAEEITALFKNPPEPPKPPKTKQKSSGKNKREDQGQDGQGKSQDQDQGDNGSESNRGKDADGDGDKSSGSTSPSSHDGDGSPSDASGEEESTSPSEQSNIDANDSGGSGASAVSRKEQLRNLKKLQKNPEADGIDVGLGEILKEALDKCAETAGTDDKGSLIPCTMLPEPGDLGQIRGFEEQIPYARRKTAKLRTQLAGLLQAVDLKQAFPSRVGHRINGRAVHLVGTKTPDTRVFTARRERVKENTALVILADRSGSMDGPKIVLSQKTAFVVSEALELLPGITCAVGAFPYENNVADGVLMLKDFGAKPKPEHFNINGRGSTPTGGALLWAGMVLTHRRETRKVVILITDGEPDSVTHTTQSIKRLRDCGVEVYGVGIGKNAQLHEWLEEQSTIQKIEQLPAALIGVLKRALLTHKSVA